MSAQTRDDLERAIMAHAQSEGLLDAGDVAGDWAVICHVPNLNATPEERDAYLTLYSQDIIPGHVSIGLWHQGLARATQEQ